MASKRGYGCFFAAMTGLAMIMAVGTSVAAVRDTGRSKPFRSLTQPTTQVQFPDNIARITQTKSRLSDNAKAIFADMVITEQVALSRAIFFLIFFVFLPIIVGLCIVRNFVRIKVFGRWI